MSFLRADKIGRRILTAYKTSATVIAGLFILWALPSPYTSHTGGTDGGVLGPIHNLGNDLWIINVFAFRYWPELNWIQFILTFALTLIYLKWCIALHQHWLHGTSMKSWLWEPQESRRRRLGLCPTCGYDLRFDYAAGCPECGWRRDI